LNVPAEIKEASDEEDDDSDSDSASEQSFTFPRNHLQE
jgi:hypothetical protein